MKKDICRCYENLKEQKDGRYTCKKCGKLFTIVTRIKRKNIKIKRAMNVRSVRRIKYNPWKGSKSIKKISVSKNGSL